MSAPLATQASDHDFRWMDCFRAVAAFAVVLSHARDLVLRDYAGPAIFAPFYAATGLGHSAVIVFFVLSGFWISRSVLGRLDQPQFWFGYLIDRIARLAIVLIPALLLGGLIDWLGGHWLGLPVYRGASGAHAMPPDFSERLAWPVLLGNLVFLQTIAVPTWGSNGPLWSLANEFWYYLWFPAIALTVVRRKATLALATLAIAAFNPVMLAGFGCWLTGTALLAWRSRTRSGSERPNAVRYSLTALSALVCLAALLAAGRAESGWADLGLAAAFALMLASLHASALVLPAWLAPVAAYGRNASYSLYLIHYPLLAFAAGLILPEGRLPPAAGAVALVAGLAIACTSLAWLFAFLTERHTDGLRNWLRGLGLRQA